MKKQIPNIITAARIALSAALIFTENFSALFYVLYFVCGMSDMADGFLAKKLDAESPFGSKLDSLADFIFVAVTRCGLLLHQSLNASVGCINALNTVGSLC